MNKCNIPHAAGLSGTQFSTLNSADIDDPERPEKYNDTGVKYETTFYSCHTALDTCCCDVEKSINKVIPRKHNHNIITHYLVKQLSSKDTEMSFRKVIV
jgi:hypothetical protein